MAGGNEIRSTEQNEKDNLSCAVSEHYTLKCT